WGRPRRPRRGTRRTPRRSPARGIEEEDPLTGRTLGLKRRRHRPAASVDLPVAQALALDLAVGQEHVGLARRLHLGAEAKQLDQRPDVRGGHGPGHPRTGATRDQASLPRPARSPAWTAT